MQLESFNNPSESELTGDSSGTSNAVESIITEEDLQHVLDCFNGVLRHVIVLRCVNSTIAINCIVLYCLALYCLELYFLYGIVTIVLFCIVLLSFELYCIA